MFDFSDPLYFREIHISLLLKSFIDSPVHRYIFSGTISSITIFVLGFKISHVNPCISQDTISFFISPVNTKLSHVYISFIISSFSN